MSLKPKPGETAAEFSKRERDHAEDNPAPKWVPDWDRVFAGEPKDVNFPPDELKELTKELPRPVKAEGRKKPPGDEYPRGKWQHFVDETGQAGWIHVDAITRSKMRCFQRRAQ